MSRNLSLAAVFALLASGAMLYFGTGLHPHWWLTWIAPIPVLVAAPRLSRRAAFAVAFLAWAIGGLNLWSYLHHLLSIPIAATIFIIAGPSLMFAAAVLLYRWVVAKSVFRAALIFPSSWVCFEFLNALTSPHSTAGNLAYSQMEFLPVLQIASITGIWAVSFCIFLFAATAATVISRLGSASQRRKLALAISAVLLATLGFGFWRLHATTAVGPTVTVGLLASDLHQNILADTPPDTLRLLRDYAAHAEGLAGQGARVIVIPEKIAVLLDSDLPEADLLLHSTAAKTGALIVVGVIHPTTGAKWNEARLYFPDGTIRTYEKHHMLPVYEGPLTVGTERTEWHEPSGLWGITICKDMDFPQLSREYGNDGVALLLVPAWDFGVDGWWHGRMAILRGVESGFSIVRAPKEGILSVSDNRGRVLAERSSDSSPFANLVASVPVQHESTVYDRLGNWFGWLNVAFLVLLVATSVRHC
jgi:apolipoprotein N-acyltransferase